MIIEGTYDQAVGGTDHYGAVYIDGVPLDPRHSQTVWNHSPDGFAWGYGGSGSAQLALAILLTAGVPERDAVALHQRFKAAFIATLPQESFRIDVDVPAWAETMRPFTAMPSEDNA
jgi:hypothetical protein